MPRKSLTDDDGEVREITAEDLAHFQPAQDVMPAEFLEGMKRLRGQRGPQKAPTKSQVTLRLDQDIIEHFKAGGKGWQTRLNDTLRALIER